MRRVYEVISICFLTCMQVAAQSVDSMDAILMLVGVTDPEEIDEYELERLQSMIENPLRLNVISYNKLAASGLFSAYQIASLLDYRQRHGDLMSFMELSAVDGFNEDIVHRIRPFVSLEGSRLVQAQSQKIRNDIAVRTGIKPMSDSDLMWNYGMKYSVDTPYGLYAGGAVSRSYSFESITPDSYAGTLEYEFRKLPLRLLAGDFNLRYGQGLALWNGMSMSGLSSPSSYMRKPSGISKSASFTGNYSFKGLAASVMCRHFAVNASVAFPGSGDSDEVSIMPSLNMVWNHRYGQIGLTHYMDFISGIDDMKSSVDVAWCLDGKDLFAEITYDWVNKVPAAIAGMTLPAGESFRLGSMIRAYPSSFDSKRSGAQRSTTKCSNEYAASVAAEYISPSRKHSASISFDAAYFPESKEKDSASDTQFRMNGSWVFSSDELILKARITERVRTWGEPFRTDFRADASVIWDKWSLNTRINLLHCKSLSGLGYAEVVYDRESVSLYLRGGLFLVDNWDDRIYVYERDAPGGFNVPAMYGRGVWCSAVVSIRVAYLLKIYARASFTSYVLMAHEKKKPGKAELKLQCILSF